jgi:hypothetical protein
MDVLFQKKIPARRFSKYEVVGDEVYLRENASN